MICISGTCLITEDTEILLLEKEDTEILQGVSEMSTSMELYLTEIVIFH